VAGSSTSREAPTPLRAPPLSEPVSGGIPPESWLPVVLGSRNVYLADRVHAAEYGRIVITYGAADEPGWLAEMQKRDESWAPTERRSAVPCRRSYGGVRQDLSPGDRFAEACVVGFVRVGVPSGE
jgi:hypothetical protein